MADGTYTEWRIRSHPHLEIPRFIFPGMLHHRHFYTVPTTLLKASSVVVRRGGYFKRHIVSGELTYTFQTSATSMHQWTPLSIEYAYMSSRTPQFVSLLASTPYLQVSMRDQFIPRFRYSYLYTSPKQLYNPIWFQVTASEAGNMLSLGYMVAGKGWSTKDKEMFKNPYAQFLKLEAEYRKTWRVADRSQLVAHVGAGIIWSYGNSSGAPWSEQFYVGGANSVRFHHTQRGAWFFFAHQCHRLLFRPDGRPQVVGQFRISAAVVWQALWSRVPRCWQRVDFARRCPSSRRQV